MTAEVDKRGFREETIYDFAGRASKGIRKDGTEIAITPVQVQGLLPPAATISPFSAPATFGLDTAQSTYVDANGNVSVSQLDGSAQLVAAFDGEGPLPSYQRNEKNLVTTRVDGRGFSTRYEYDVRGNVTAIDDSPPVIASPIVIEDSGLSLTRRIPFESGNSANFNPVDGLIYAAKRHGANQGLYRVSADGSSTLIAGAANPAAVVVDPDDGDIFVSEDFGGGIFRTAFGATGRQLWVSGLNAGDDDPVGMAIATNDYTGTVIAPGEALVVDRGFQGEDEVWRFSPDASEGEQVVHDDNGTFINPADVAITPSKILVVDLGEEQFENGGVAPGTIYELGVGGTLTPLVTSEVLRGPNGIAYDPLSGHLLVVDYVDRRLVEVNQETGEVTVLLTNVPIAGDAWASVDVSADGNQIAITGRQDIFVFTRSTPSLGRREFTYDPVFSQLTSETDELGRVTTYEIDPLTGNLLSTTQIVGFPDSTSAETDDVTTQFTYLANGLVDTMTDPLGRVTEYDYDALGRLQTITFAVGTADEAFQSFAYDAAGNQIAVIDENGNRTEFEYDQLNRITRLLEADPDELGPLNSPITTFGYDDAGNLVESIDAANSRSVSEFDEMDRLVRSLNALSNETVMEYDLGGNLVASIDPNGNTMRYVYDERDRQVKSIDPSGGITSFRYDADGNLVSLTDPIVNRTVFSYDLRDRLIREMDALGEETLYEYDSTNNLVRKTDRNARKTEFIYDDLNRLLQETWVNVDDSIANEINQTYDKNGNRLSMADGVSSLAFAYDQRDRVTTVDNVGTLSSRLPNVILTYTYDGVGNVTSVAEQFDGAADAMTSYAYDGLNRNTSIRQSGGGANEKLVDLVYNQLGQFDEISRYSDLSRNNLVARSGYSYDGINRLVSLEHGTAFDARAIAFYDYEYDAASRISAITDIDGSTEYRYDDRDQLTGASRDTSDIRRDERYKYDEIGNRVDSHLHGSSYLTGPGNRLISDGQYEYEYDSEGNMVRRVDKATGEARELSFDHRNRLLRVSEFTAAGEMVQDVSYSYDVVDRRIAKAVDSDGAGVAAETATYFVYDRTNVLLDYFDRDRSDGDSQPQLSVRYLMGSGIDQVVAQEDVQVGEAEWLLPDHLFTIRDIIDDEANILNHIFYDGFGGVVSQSNSELSTRYMFTGREFDESLRVYYYRARFYDATIGRFLSEDPIGFNGGDANIYRYVGNSPIANVDPSGLKNMCEDVNVFVKPSCYIATSPFYALMACLEALRDAFPAPNPRPRTPPTLTPKLRPEQDEPQNPAPKYPDPELQEDTGPFDPNNPFEGGDVDWSFPGSDGSSSPRA